MHNINEHLYSGCEILAKAEFCNGGGSVKDRAAYFLIKDAEEKGVCVLFFFCKYSIFADAIHTVL